MDITTPAEIIADFEAKKAETNRKFYKKIVRNSVITLVAIVAVLVTSDLLERKIEDGDQEDQIDPAIED